MMLDYTFKFKTDGIVINDDLGPVDMSTGDFVPFIDVTRVSGLSSAPFRITERDREGADGGFIDVEFEKARLVVIEGTLYSPSSQVEPFLDNLKANFAPSNDVYPLYLQAPGIGERVLFCKSYGVQYDWDMLLRLGSTNLQIQLIAEDPAFYDSEPTSSTTSLAQPFGGRGYNKGYNYGYAGTYIITDFYDDVYSDMYGVPATPSDGSVHITNGGNRPTGAVITIYGPILTPVVAHDNSGRQLGFDIELLTNQYLTIDLRNRTVLLNGTSNRRSKLIGTSKWFLLPPGENSLRLLGTDTTSGIPDPTMQVVIRGAYR